VKKKNEEINKQKRIPKFPTKNTTPLIQNLRTKKQQTKTTCSDENSGSEKSERVKEGEVSLWDAAKREKERVLDLVDSVAVKEGTEIGLVYE